MKTAAAATKAAGKAKASKARRYQPHPMLGMENRMRMKVETDTGRSWEGWLELDPGNPGRMRDLACFPADCQDATFRDYDRALPLLRTAIERAKEGGPTEDWDAARLWTVLGLAQYRAGKPEDASESLVKVVALRASAQDERYWLAMAQWRLGKRDAARASYALASVWRKRVLPRAEYLLHLDAEVAALLELPSPSE